MQGQISVIIPVYNAAPFLEQAVSSALDQRETGEVILVEDNSEDNSYAVCLRLSQLHSSVRLYRHADEGNHGAGASRNLGLAKAGLEFVSFLDADDYYLNNRFASCLPVFEKYPDTDGVFGAMAVTFTSAEAKRRFLQYGSEPELITMHREVAPERLFQTLLEAQSGFFHFATLVIRRKSLLRKGITFDENMEIAQDVDFVYQLAGQCRLRPYDLKRPSMIRRFHENNRVYDHAKEVFYRTYLYRKWFGRIIPNRYPPPVNRMLLRYHIDHLPAIRRWRQPMLLRIFLKTIAIVFLCLRRPVLIGKLI